MDILVVEDGPVKIFKDRDAFAAFVKRLTFRKQSERVVAQYDQLSQSSALAAALEESYGKYGARLQNAFAAAYRSRKGKQVSHADDGLLRARFVHCVTKDATPAARRRG